MVSIPDSMRAAAVDEFGSPANLTVHTVPVPAVGDDEVLIRVHTSGVGVWDPFELSGGFRSMGQRSGFPYVPGSDASGTVVGAGDSVRRFTAGDQVYASTFLNPKGGSYAEYVAVKAGRVAAAPAGVDLGQAGALAVDAITAMSGLRGVLELREGQVLLVFGASGGVGHLVVQLAKRMGAKVFGVASGKYGVEVVRHLGADEVVDGRGEDPVHAARGFAGDGFDAALLTAGGDRAAALLGLVKQGGRACWPHGVEPTPQLPERISGGGYNGEGGAKVLEAVNRLAEAGSFSVHIARTFDLSEASTALRALDEHFVGKLAIRLTG